MHFQPSGIPQGKAGVKVRKYLSDLLPRSETKQTELGEITVPSTFHHGLIILLHMCHHLTGDGLGLRHLCDWAVFINSIGEEKFLEMFEKVEIVFGNEMAVILNKLRNIQRTCYITSPFSCYK